MSNLKVRVASNFSGGKYASPVFGILESKRSPRELEHSSVPMLTYSMDDAGWETCNNSKGLRDSAGDVFTLCPADSDRP